MSDLDKRFGRLEVAIRELVRRSDEQKRLDAKRREIAKELIGMPYYWNDWSGVVKPCSQKPTHVEVHITDQYTNQSTFWVLDAFRALEVVLEAVQYSSWEEYNRAKMMAWEEEFRGMLESHGWSQDRINEKLAEFYQKQELRKGA